MGREGQPMSVDPDPLSERGRSVSRRELEMLDDEPTTEVRESADVGEGVAELLGDD